MGGDEMTYASGVKITTHTHWRQFPASVMRNSMAIASGTVSGEAVRLCLMTTGRFDGYP